MIYLTVDVANKSLDILTKHQVLKMQINSLWEILFSFFKLHK